MTTVLVFAVVLVLALATSARCARVQLERGDEASVTIQATKTEYALAVISDADYLAHEPSCVADAIRYLGLRRAEAAIPQLVKLLSYAVPTPQCEGPGGWVTGVGTGCGPKGPFAWVKYPALDALHRIGKPATMQLVAAVATAESNSVESRNALDAFMDIYREDINGALRILNKAASKQGDALGAVRLEDAVQRVRSDWCKYSYPQPCRE